MWTYGNQQQGGWSYPQMAAAQVQKQSKNKSSIADLFGAFGGLIKGLGEHPVGDTAPNIDGMEGMDVTGPGSVSAPEAPAPMVPRLIEEPSPATAPSIVSEPTPHQMEPTGHPYEAPTMQPTNGQSVYTPGQGQMVPLAPMAVGYGPPAPGDPFAAIQNDPRYLNRIPASGPAALDINNVREVHLHDRGGSTPSRGSYRALPYHVEVQPSGQIQQTRGADQMGAGSYKSNPRTLHVAYGGKVGALPTKPAMSSLQRVYETLKMHNPSWQFPSHGQAFNATQAGPWRASIEGRGLDEARWRGFLK